MKILIVGGGGREHAMEAGAEPKGREVVLCTGKCRNCRGG